MASRSCGLSADGFGVEGEPRVAGRPQTLGQGGRLLGLRRELLIMMELIIQPAGKDEFAGQVEFRGVDRAGPFGQGAADGQGLLADLQSLCLVADLVGQAAELVVGSPQCRPGSPVGLAPEQGLELAVELRGPARRRVRRLSNCGSLSRTSSLTPEWNVRIASCAARTAAGRGPSRPRPAPSRRPARHSSRSAVGWPAPAPRSPPPCRRRPPARPPRRARPRPAAACTRARAAQPPDRPGRDRPAPASGGGRRPAPGPSCTAVAGPSPGTSGRSSPGRGARAR